MALKPNLNTVRNRIFTATSYESSLTGSSSNTYLGIAKPLSWTSNVPPVPVETTSNVNDIFRTLVSLKKITSSDINLVVPRVDWASGTTYTEYTENLDLYTYDTLTAIQGVADAFAESVTLDGIGTAFNSNVASGDIIVLLGDGSEGYPKVAKEVIEISDNSTLTVNSAFSASYSDNAIYKLTNSYPNYANKFYVRNSLDQVFKCLYNNFSVASTVMPEIRIDGQLPENAYIETSDGYKWKYMYSIPAGLKEKFFTSQWMPVLSENIVTSSAVDGRLDIIKIYNGGTGYLGGANSNSAAIVTVTGDGSSANLTARVVSGIITNINILNSGTNYTNVAISFSDGSKTPGTNTANVIAVIGPQNGHGYDPAYELGATSLMISADLAGSENSTIPTTTASDIFDYRQIVLLRNPKNISGTYLSQTNYRATSTISVSPPPSSFRMDEIVYQGISLATASFYATVVNWDSSANELSVNNSVGSFSPGTLKGTTQTSAVTAFSLTLPDNEGFTGEILYIENRDPITRSSSQTEQIKLVLNF
jgi:hypothetical protein